MPSVLATTNADLKACLVRLRRIGDAASEIVERQDRTDIPAIGDVIEVAVAEATVPARVIQVKIAGAEQIITIEADELSSSYIWDTFTALAQHEAGESAYGARPGATPMKPHLAFSATLNLVRQCHALAREALERPKPDLRTALRHMRVARRAGWLAFPYIESEELRRRIVSYKPMSATEWQQLWPPHAGQ
jgi:hypothetical protein